MHLSYLPPTKNMYCQEYILNKKFLFVAIKCDIKGIKEFWMSGFIDFFVINGNTLSSHMYKISLHNNWKTHKIHSYYGMGEMLVNLDSKKGDENDDSYPKITHI